ncbi:hypothetical protein [Nonomuraea basaltis]|uniref:hypothetical protein n=1 Tax=Nonomuraea basaltis TaxID=2495887 RepID=UPI0014865AB0|nr:hypothetical protein [Nonomuraea basaltis]
MPAAFRADREGFVGVRMVRLPGGEWLDVAGQRRSGGLTHQRGVIGRSGSGSS